MSEKIAVSIAGGGGQVFSSVQTLSPGCGFVVGCNEESCLNVGWHNREIRQPDGVAYRAVEESASFYLKVPSGKDWCLKILMTAPVPLLGADYSGTLFMGDSEIGRIQIGSDNWVLRCFRIGKFQEAGLVPFVLSSDHYFIPAEKLDGNRDMRRIACYIGAVVLEEIEVS